MVEKKKEEKINYSLEKLYRRYGYSYYNMSNFEEYDLYAKNRNFLSSSRILSFTDVDGRLMAFKPDMTLSIIKNTDDDDTTKKIYYTEHVVRVPKGGDGFREILQTGLECLGDIDTYQTAEVIELASGSLAEISDDYILDITDLGIIDGIIGDMDEGLQEELLEKVSEKNLHGIRSICKKNDIDEKTCELIVDITKIYDRLDKGIEKLEKLDLPEASRNALNELKELASILDNENIYADFSMVDDRTYYNGIIFKGFVSGVAQRVLSGGRYDNLMKRMEKKNGAIGFAVYMDLLEAIDEGPLEYDCDVLIIYDDESDMSVVRKMRDEYLAESLSVRVQKDDKVKAEKVIKISGGEVAEIG